MSKLNKSKAYRAWANMRYRCNNPKAKKYPRYGGRGISCCASWNDYYAFIAYVGQPPSKQHSLERLDNNGNYEPGNVVWATAKEQTRNRPNTNKLTDYTAHEIYKAYHQDNVLQADIALKYGVTQSCVSLVVNSKRWAK